MDTPVKNQELMNQCNRALSKVKIALMTQPNTAFFTSLVLSLKHSFCEETPTAYTDGLNIVYGTQFFMDLKPEERLFLMLHETLHVALLHTDPLRLLSRNPRKWNIAADYVINYILVEKGFVMPEEGLYDAKYAGMTVEQVYNLLPEENQLPDLPMEDLKPGKGSSSTSTSQQTSEDLTRKVQQVLVRAATAAKMEGESSYGNIPGDIQIILDSLLNPKMPWQVLLKRFKTSITHTDYSMRRPNRRFMPDYYLPSLYSEGMSDLAVFVDTSGSVSDEDFHQQITEAHQILKTLKPKRMHFGQFDTDIKSVDVLTKTQDFFRVSFSGRGGTYIEPVFDWAKKNNPKLLVIFTDGYFVMPEDYLKMPVLWMIYNNKSFQAPFGKVIHFEL